MASVDASSLSDPTRVRRTVLAQRHDAAVRGLAAALEGGEDGVPDKAVVAEAQKALASVTAEIEAEYAEPAEGRK